MSSKHVVLEHGRHIELARHIAAGNRSDQVQPIASDNALQLVTDQSQYAQSSADREAAICRRKINRLCQVTTSAHVTFDALTYHQRDSSTACLHKHTLLQAIQNADLCLVSHSELSPVLRQLQQCYNQITQSAAAPPIDAAIVQGTVAEVTGLQKRHKRKHVQIGPPQPGGARPNRVKTKKKHTELL